MPCAGLADGWAVGAKDFCPVDDVFVRLVPGSWYGISYHLNNGDAEPGIVDVSGFNMTVVPKRELDAVGLSYAETGVGMAFSLYTGFEIPPEEPRTQFKTYTQFSAFPESGVFVQSVMLHMHKVGRKSWTIVHRPKPGLIGNASSGAPCPSDCHWRLQGLCMKCFSGFCAGTLSTEACLNGMCCSLCSACQGCEKCYPHHPRANPKGSEADWFDTFDIGCNLEYDFNQQLFASMPLRQVKIYPTDVLEQVCEYDTTGVKNITRGGEGTNNEMCITTFRLVESLASLDSSATVSFSPFTSSFPPPNIPEPVIGPESSMTLAQQVTFLGRLRPTSWEIRCTRVLCPAMWPRGKLASSRTTPSGLRVGVTGAVSPSLVTLSRTLH